MPSEFSIVRTVEFAETDMAGIMHFSNFFRWMEACETAFYRSMGLSLISFLPGDSSGWPRVSVSCEYKAPLHFNDTVQVRLLVKEIRNKAVVYAFQFRKMTGGVAAPEIAAQGEMAAVFVKADAQRRMTAQPIPEDVRKQLQLAAASAFQD